MNEQQYYTEIEHLIKKHEVSKRARKLEVNNDLVMLMSIPKCTKKGIYLCTKRGMKLYT